MQKIIINYKFESLNNYINKCRTNYYMANKIKQQETDISMMYFARISKIENYPIELIFNWHMKSKIADLDGRFAKNIIDGLVKANKIPDDNVKYIQKITHNYIEDEKDYVEIKIIEKK